MPDRAVIAFHLKDSADYAGVIIEHFHPTGRGISMLKRVADVHGGNAAKLQVEVLGRPGQRFIGETPSALLLQVSDADWIVTWDGESCRVWVSSPLRHGLSLWGTAHAGEAEWTTASADRL
jgi:hypothetical protein